MQLSPHLRLAEWLLLFAWAIMITFGSPLHTTLEPDELAARPITSQLPRTTLNANENIRYNAKRHNLERKLEVAKLHADYSYSSLHTGLRIRRKHEYQSALRSRSVSVSSIKAHKPPALSVKPRTSPLSTFSKGFTLEKFHVTATITPVMVAAQYLEDFYDLIALKIETGYWNGVPPMHSLVLTRWNYQLKFFCYAAPIPWEFIQEVAIEMSEWAVRGFTAQYDAVYKAVDQFGKEIFVSVVMDMVMNGEGSKDDPILV